MRPLHLSALTLAVVGALNWGLWGLFQIDLVAELLGGGDSRAALPRVVYGLVGLAGVVAAGTAFAVHGEDRAHAYPGAAMTHR